MGKTTEQNHIGILGANTDQHLADTENTSTGWAVRTGNAEVVYAVNPDLVLALDTAAFRTAISTDPSVPVLPYSVPHSNHGPSASVPDLISAIENGHWRTHTYPILELSLGSTRVPAVFDATVMTAEPARISEYTIRHQDTSETDELETVRADGIVVATPIGSTGYAAAAGGPQINTGTDVVGVVPVAPFAVERSSWIVHPTVTIDVQRDEGTVEAFADGAPITALEQGDSLTCEWGGTVILAEMTTADKKT